MDATIVADDLCKSYKEVAAIKDISLKIDKGEIFGLIGPDGAGKTTLFRILTTLSLADSGTASVCGLDVVKDYVRIRSEIGYMPGALLSLPGFECRREPSVLCEHFRDGYEIQL